MDRLEKAMIEVDRVEEAGSRRHYVKWSVWRRQEAVCDVVSVEEAEAAGSMYCKAVRVGVAGSRRQ